MAELDEKLNAFLSDPDSMAQVMQLAQQLSGGMGGESPSSAPPPESPPQAAPSTLPGGFDPQLLGRIMPLLQEAGQSNSQTMQLLTALRPFLKPEKQAKVERAVQLSHLIHVGKKFLLERGKDLV